jgi:hypothetical protein
MTTGSEFDINQYVPDAVKSFFYPTKPGEPLTYEAIQTRRKMAEAIMARRRGTPPKNIGEGLTALGEGIGDRATLNDLDRREAGLQATRDPAAVQFGKAMGIPYTGGTTGPAAPGVPARAPAQTSEVTPEPEGNLGPAVAAYQAERDGDPSNPPPAPGALPPSQWSSGNLAAYNGPRAAPGTFSQAAPNPVRDQLARASMPAALAAPGVPQPNFTPAGEEIPPTTGGDTTTTPTRVASLTPSGVTPDTVGNPPIPTQIQLAPDRVAQAGGTSGIPVAAPRSAPVPEPSPQSLGRPPEVALQPSTEPEPPKRREYLTEKERQGWDMRLRARGDPYITDLADKLIATGKQERDDEYARAITQYNTRVAYDKEARLKEQQRAYEARLPENIAKAKKAEADVLALQQAAEKRAKYGEGGEEPLRTTVLKSRETAKGIPDAMEAIRTAQEMINKGIFTGQASQWNTLKDRFAQGFLNADESQKVINTETYQASLRKLMAAVRAGIAGTQGQNPQEQYAIEQAIALNPSLQKGTMINILGNLHKGMLNDALEHQSKAWAYIGDPEKYPNDARVWAPQMSLPMHRIVPQGAVDSLRTQVEALKKDGKDAEITKLMREFDDDFNSPGTAKDVLRFRR